MNIQEASQRTNLSIDTIRYYEKEKMIPPIPRGDNGYRQFGAQQLGQLEFVQKLRAAGVRVEVIKEYTRLFLLDAEATASNRKALLVKEYQLLGDQLVALNAARDLLALKLKDHFRLEKLEESLRSEYD